MGKSFQISPLQRRILKLYIQTGRRLEKSKVAAELGKDIGSVSRSIDALESNRDLKRDFAATFLKVEEMGLFEEERKTPTQTMAATRARKFLAGNHVGSAPTGGKVEEGVISFFPSWVPRIRRAFRLRAEGCTYSEIEEEIGIPQGKLNYMLHNPAYCGKVRHKGMVGDGKHDGIISEDLFKRVQHMEKQYGDKDACYGFKAVRGRLVPKEGEAEEIEEMFLMRLQKKPYRKIGDHLNCEWTTIQWRISNPKYAGKKLVDGKLVDDPRIEPIVDFETWKEAQEAHTFEDMITERKKKGADNKRKLWKALPGAYDELVENTRLTATQVDYYLRLIKDKGRIVKLYDARWYPKDELALELQRKLNKKNWNSLLPQSRQGIENRDKLLLHLLSNGPSSPTPTSRKTGISRHIVNYWFRKFLADGIVEQRSDCKYYIPDENARFLQTAQKLLEAVRNQYS